MKETKVPYRAPDFSLVSAAGTRVSLADFHGSWLILYFYPKDDTPGCTIEACSLRDKQQELEGLGAYIVGVSMDSPDEHVAFQKKYGLKFTLLSDPRAEVIQRYGAWGKKMFGREGIQRKTFLIDPDGMVRKVYGRVTPVEHGAKIAADLRELQ